jgi:hypothetical protein
MPMVKSGRSDLPDILVSPPSPGIADEFERIGMWRSWFEAYRFLSLTCVADAQRPGLLAFFDAHPEIVANVGTQVEAMIPGYRSRTALSPRLTRGFWTVLEDCLGQQGTPLAPTAISPQSIEMFFAGDAEWRGLHLPIWQDLLLDPRHHPENFRWRSVERLPDGRLRFVPK